MTDVAMGPMRKAFDAWLRKPERALKFVAKDLQVPEAQVRTAFVVLCGGEAKFTQRTTGKAPPLPKAGPPTKTKLAPAVVERPAGSRVRPVLSVVAQTIRPNDSGAKVWRSMSTTKGWAVRRVYEPVVVKFGKDSDEKHGHWRQLLYTVHISPKGREYVECTASERADILHVGVTKELGVDPVRLCRIERSKVAQKFEKRLAQLDRVKTQRATRAEEHQRT